MIVTEKEAKLLRCCGPVPCGTLSEMAYQEPGGPVHYRRLCIGSECMAWDWIDRIDAEGKVWRRSHNFSGESSKPSYEQRGCCSLAKPLSITSTSFE